jgi:hypothetical protein
MKCNIVSSTEYFISNRLYVDLKFLWRINTLNHSQAISHFSSQSHHDAADSPRNFSGTEYMFLVSVGFRLLIALSATSVSAVNEHRGYLMRHYHFLQHLPQDITIILLYQNRRHIISAVATATQSEDLCIIFFFVKL